MARCISLTSSEEYLCGVYYCDGLHRDCAIYRWNLTGLHGGAEPETTYFRLPAIDTDLCVGAFAPIGSKIYMIGGYYIGSSRCSTDIFVVDTEKLRTKDAAQIVRKIPSVLRSVVSRRNAVAIGGKIYTFPVYLGYGDPPPPPSRFEVFDPVTETTALLPEPDFLEDVIDESHLVLKSRLLLCTRGYCLFAFDTAHPGSGWRDVTADVMTNSICYSSYPLPFFSNRLKGECATALGGRDDDRSRFFAGWYHGIVMFGDEPPRNLWHSKRTGWENLFCTWRKCLLYLSKR